MPHLCSVPGMCKLFYPWLRRNTLGLAGAVDVFICHKYLRPFEKISLIVDP